MKGDKKMNMPGFTAEAVLGRPTQIYINYGATYQSHEFDARVAPTLQLPQRKIVTGTWAELFCYDDCYNECVDYGLDTPVRCANDCYLGCNVATS
jgi:hypothetical protein